MSMTAQVKGALPAQNSPEAAQRRRGRLDVLRLQGEVQLQLSK